MKLNATLLLCFILLLSYSTSISGETTTKDNLAPAIACNGFTYCESFGNSVADEWIESFTFADIDNASGVDGGYADFTSFSTDITLGDTYMVSGTPGYSGTTFTEFFRVWIDYNIDGDFDDPNELVFESGATTAVVNGIVSIPVDATLGITTLRVSMKFNTASTPCETGNTGFTFGEVEDYCVNILPGNGCYTPIINISDITDVGALATWTDVADAESYNVRYREVGTMTWTEMNLTNNSLTLDLLGCAIYEAQVQSLCAGGLTSGYSFSSEFLTFGCGNCLDLTYCTIENPFANSFIENVSLNTMNSTSGNDNGYADNTGPVTTSIDKGVTYAISTTAGDGNYPSDKWYAAFIDFNADGDFDDAFEKIMDSEDQIIDLTFSDNFLVPADAVVGTTRLRVFVQNFDNDGPDPCQAFMNGEAEDYCIEITPGNGCYQTALTISDITDTDALISWLAIDASESYNVRYRELGTAVWTELNTTNNSITIDLDGCTFYEVQVETLCGGGLSSGYTLSSEFITFGCGNCLDLTYCTIEDANDNSFIENVTLNTMNSNSGNDGGYADNTGPFTTSIDKGVTYSISTTAGDSPFPSNKWYAAYIDFNADGDFDDDFEKVMDSEEQTADLTFASAFLVPANAVVGTTRLRVFVQNFDNDGPDPCQTFLNGEAEDYCIEITPGNGCYQTAVTVSDITDMGALVSWLAVDASESYTVRYREIGVSTWTEENTTNNSITLDLLECTSYEVQVQTNCGGGLNSGYTLSTTFLTFGCGACIDLSYCESEATNATDDFIESVVFGSLDNVSGNDNGYADFGDDFGAMLLPGETYNMVLTPGWTNFMFNVTWTVWIDYNQDGDFEDADEMVFTAENSVDIQTTDITIPLDATIGLTKMRISQKEFSMATPCETFTYGEVEDYCLTIQPAVLPCLIPQNLDTMDVTSASVNMIWDIDAFETAIGYIIRFKELAATDWMEFSAEFPTYEAFGLTICTDYEYQVRSVCPQDVSEYSESFVYQTSCFVGTEDLDRANINALKVYPNPFTDKIILDFELKKSNTVSIRLLNMNGQLIQERLLSNLGEGSHQFELLQADLAAGLYMIQLATADEVVIRKVVKQ